MFRIRSKSQEFDRNLQPRVRGFGFPTVALRRRSADHPMMMFAVLAVAVLVAMAFVPTSGPAFASFGPFAPTKIERTSGGEAKAARLPMSETDIACRGQAWGAEDASCLATILKESGRDDIRNVRTVADFDITQASL